MNYQTHRDTIRRQEQKVAEAKRQMDAAACAVAEYDADGGSPYSVRGEQLDYDFGMCRDVYKQEHDRLETLRQELAFA